jgi:hypothetical protein
MKSTVVALAALFAIAGAASAQQIATNSYYPLKVGSKWSYADVASGEKFTLQVTGSEAANGVTAFKLQKVNDTDFDVVSNEVSGIKCHARHFNGVHSKFAPGVTFAPAQATMNVATTTNPNFKNPATGNNTLWTSKIDAIEDVAVPAGKFAKCIRIELVIKDEKLGTVLAKINMWLAPGVGMVQRKGQFFGVFYVQQLTSFTL